MPNPTTTTNPDAVRTQLVEFLRGGSAHADARTVLADMPESHFNLHLEGVPHTPWQLLYHLKFTLHDLLEFCTSEDYVAPEWPDDYWPGSDLSGDARAWNAAADEFLSDLAGFEALIEDPATDLEARIPWGSGQTILREALLAIDHTSYHLGQLVLVRKQLGDWKG